MKSIKVMWLQISQQVKRPGQIFEFEMFLFRLCYSSETELSKKALPSMEKINLVKETNLKCRGFVQIKIRFY